MHSAGIENILGFKKKGETLIIDPCIPQAWEKYSLKYRYNDTVYDINIKNPHGVSKGVERISVDKKFFAGNQISLVDDGKVHVVEVIMGE